MASAPAGSARCGPISDLILHWTIVVNLLAGGIIGAWLGDLGHLDALAEHH